MLPSGTYGPTGEPAVLMPPNATAAVVYVSGNPAPLARMKQGDGAAGRWFQGSGQRRSHHTVLVDLATGRETLWSEMDERVAVSPDGKRVAAIAFISPNYNRPRLRVWEVASRRLFTNIQLSPGMTQWYMRDRQLGWSPNGRWLTWTKEGAISHSLPGGRGQIRTTFLETIRPDGANRRELCLYEGIPGPALPEHVADWKWAPQGDAIYLLHSDGAVYRYSPEDGARTLLWRVRPALEPGRRLMVRSLHLSPDGKRLAVWWWTEKDANLRPEQMEARGCISLLELDGDRARVLAEPRFKTMAPRLLCWAPDGKTFFASLDLYWHDGQQEFAALTVPNFHGAFPQLTTFPVGSGVVIVAPWARNQLLAIDAAGGTHTLTPPRGDFTSYQGGTYSQTVPDGLDAEGRLIMHYEPGKLLFALDPGPARATPSIPKGGRPCSRSSVKNFAKAGRS